MLTAILYVYLSGFVGYEGYSVYEYVKGSNASRVITRGEALALDTAANVVWPVKAAYQIKNKFKGKK